MKCLCFGKGEKLEERIKWKKKTFHLNVSEMVILNRLSFFGTFNGYVTIVSVIWKSSSSETCRQQVKKDVIYDFHYFFNDIVL